LTASGRHRSGVALSESAAIDSVRRALGAELAAYRRAAGLNQSALATHVGYSRSTVANVETGRQHVPPDFWKRADAACRADGALTGASARVEAMARRARLDAVRQGRSTVLGPARDTDAIHGEALEPLSGEIVPTPVDEAEWADVVAAAASQARGRAEQAAVTGIGPGTVEQLTADVARLSRSYVSAPPLPLFVAMHRGLDHIQAALDQKVYPAQARDLNFLAGALCGLMANACLDLGREEAADDLARAAWTHGRIIDHAPLMGWARGTQALAAIWDQRFADAVRQAGEGLLYVPAGMGGARLHAIHARALAACGDTAAARAAMTAAEKARADADRDELHDSVGGEFAFDAAKQRYYQSLALLDSGDPAGAERAAAEAIALYESVPVRDRSYGCAALARVQFAKAALMGDRLDAAIEALGGVLVLDPERRISSLNEHLEACRQLLLAPAYRSSGTARELEQQLAAFTAASTARALPSGP
jgi:transcriptional regulator with XRE-family HTH domain